MCFAKECSQVYFPPFFSHFPSSASKPPRPVQGPSHLRAARSKPFWVNVSHLGAGE